MHQIDDLYLCENCFSMMEPGEKRCSVCGFEKENYQPETEELAVGEILAGKYLIGKMLGRGGFGITYLGYDIQGKKKVAIKEYMPSGLASRQPGQTGLSIYSGERMELFEKGAHRFYDEAKMVSRFNGNPNIVSVYEFFYENQTAYFVMEYLDGMDLKHYTVERGGRIPVKEALEMMMPVLDALAIVHSAGVLHRDISPDNIFLTKDHQVKLIDFGAARQVIGEGSKSISVVVKQGFAPIEQYQSHGRFGPWSDVYSFCATFYFMITGEVPEAAMDRMDLDQLMAPSDMGVDIPKPLEAVLMHGMAYRPADRIQNVIELKAAFQQAASGEIPQEFKTETVYVNPYSNSEGYGNSRSQNGYYGNSGEQNSGVRSDMEPSTEYGIFQFEKNEAYYRSEFAKLEEGKRGKFHIPACFLSFYWMFYRKMFAEGGILMAVFLILSLLSSVIGRTTGNAAAAGVIYTVIGIGIAAACGFLGNKIYYRYYQKINKEAQEKGNWVYKKRSGILKGGPLAGTVAGAAVVCILISGGTAFLMGTGEGVRQGTGDAASVGAPALTGDEEDQRLIKIVKDQTYLEEESNKTNDEVMGLYFDNPAWSVEEDEDTGKKQVIFEGEGFYAHQWKKYQFVYELDGDEAEMVKFSVDGDELRESSWGTFLRSIYSQYEHMDSRSLKEVKYRFFVNTVSHTTLDEAEFYLRKAKINYKTSTNKSGEKKTISTDESDETYVFYKMKKDIDRFITQGNYILIVKGDEADAGAFLEYCMGWSQSAKTNFYGGTSEKRIQESSLKERTETEMDIIKNEIYARHGMQFDDPLMNALFSTKDWYNGRYDEDSFRGNWNSAEQYNLNLIEKVEKELGY